MKNNQYIWYVFHDGRRYINSGFPSYPIQVILERTSGPTTLYISRKGHGMKDDNLYCILQKLAFGGLRCQFFGDDKWKYIPTFYDKSLKARLTV